MIDTSSSPGQGQPLQVSVTWKDIEWLKSFAKIPILLKGILNPADAEQAVKAGVSGIIVSNHGARNLDTVPATIEVLPYITQKVNQRIPVLVDGGVRRGTDIVKAIALGANGVLIGRPICNTRDVRSGAEPRPLCLRAFEAIRSERHLRRWKPFPGEKWMKAPSASC